MISVEVDKTLHFIINVLNLLISIILFGLCIYIAKRPYENMSKSLKIYFQVCLDPYAFLLILLSIFTAIYYLIFGNTQTLLYQICRFLTTLCTQQVRLSYFFIVAGRIIATVFYKTYSKYSQSLLITVTITYITSIINGYVEYLRVFGDLNINSYTIYIVLATHFLTLILCKVLYLVNYFKYKSLAYQSSLSERHQIYENVKQLKTLWPLILIFSLIAPLGPIGVFAYRMFLGTPPPMALFFLGYNFSFLVMICWRLLKKSKQKIHHINVIGINADQAFTSRNNSKISPEIIPVEKYFNDLQKQWK